MHLYVIELASIVATNLLDDQFWVNTVFESHDTVIPSEYRVLIFSKPSNGLIFIILLFEGNSCLLESEGDGD